MVDWEYLEHKYCECLRIRWLLSGLEGGSYIVRECVSEQFVKGAYAKIFLGDDWQRCSEKSFALKCNQI